MGTLKAQSATTDDDWRECVRCYRAGADGGHPAAMVALAGLYERGQGVGADSQAALPLYQQALAAGQPEAAADVQRLQRVVKTADAH